MNSEYNRLVHAMQSGVAMDISHCGEKGAGADPKHLRVGVNVAMVESAALAKLLMDKGVFTPEEYNKALIEAHRQEVARYEARLTDRVGSGTKITLA